MNEQDEILKEISTAFDLPVQTLKPAEEVFLLLKEKINHLILHDFNRLISILYRLDISEQKLKSLLEQHKDTDAATIIADLIIERQAQKIKSRREFKQRDNTIDEEEKW